MIRLRRRKQAEEAPREHARPVERVDAPVVVLHVTRGNLACDVPLPVATATFLPAVRVAEAVVVAMLELQRKSPGRPDEPILEDDVGLALRPRGADEPISPDLPLLEQTPGHWRLEDVPTQSGRTVRLPVGAFELIDTQRRRLSLG